jgi:hypothetical protein
MGDRSNQIGAWTAGPRTSWAYGAHLSLRTTGSLGRRAVGPFLWGRTVALLLPSGRLRPTAGPGAPGRKPR